MVPATPVRPLQFPPDDRGHVPALDVIRGCAVLLVLAFHFDVPGAHAAGRMGVTLFFVLSGYLITSHLGHAIEQRHASIRHYFVRRALRILPALVVMLVVTTVIAALAGGLLTIGPAVIASGLLFANIPTPLNADLQWLGHMWSLSLEAQFYVVLPILVVAGLSSRAVGRAVVLLLGIGLLIYPEASGLGVGCLLAVSGAKIVARVWPPLAILAGFALLLVSAVIDNQSAYYHVAPAWIASVGAGLLVGAALGRSRPLLQPVASIGRISYSLYLWHLPIAALVFPFAYSLGLSWAIAALAAMALSLAVAAASYRLVERPFMSLTSGTGLRVPLARHARRLMSRTALRRQDGDAPSTPEVLSA